MFKNLKTTMDRLRDEEMKKKSRFAKDYRANIRGVIYYITHTKKEEIREKFLLKEYGEIYINIESSPIIENFINMAKDNDVEDMIVNEINKDLHHMGITVDCFYRYNKEGKIIIRLKLDLKMIDIIAFNDEVTSLWSLKEWFKR